MAEKTISEVSEHSASEMVETPLEEDLSRFRILGAIVWLGVLVLIVPVWFSHPVHFVPDDANHSAPSPRVSSAAVQPYLLPHAVKSQPTPSVSKPDSTPPPEAPSLVEDKMEHSVQLGSSASPKETKAGEWIVRIVTYKEKSQADALLDNLRYQYPAYIKQYPKSKLYSVRIGPYQDKQQAKSDQKELEQMLHVRAELVKIPASKQ